LKILSLIKNIICLDKNWDEKEVVMKNKMLFLFVFMVLGISFTVQSQEGTFVPPEDLIDYYKEEKLDVNFSQKLLGTLLGGQYKIGIENKSLEFLYGKDEEYVRKHEGFKGRSDLFSLREWSFVLRAQCLGRELSEIKENTPLLCCLKNSQIDEQYKKMNRLKQLAQTEKIEVSESLSFTEIKGHWYLTDDLQKKIYDKETGLGLTEQDKKQIEKQKTIKKTSLGVSCYNLKALALCPDQYIEEGYFVKDEDGNFAISNGFKGLYTTIYQRIAKKNRPQWLQFKFDGVTYQFPKTLDDKITVVEKKEECSDSKSVQQDAKDFDVDALMAEFGLFEDSSVMSGKKGRQQKQAQRKPVKSQKKKAVNTKQPQKKQREIAALSAMVQSEKPLCPVSIESPDIDSQLIYYTKAARSWLTKPETRLKQDGYLKEEPTTKEEQIRRNVLKRIMSLKGCQNTDEACQLIVQDHTLPCCIDRFVLEGQSKAIQMRDNEFSLKVPVCRTYKGQEENFQMGEYELFFHKTKNGHIHVYHRLFKEIEDKELFLQQNISQTAQKIEIEALIEVSQLEAAIEEGQAKWQPAEGTWNIDANNELFIKFEDTKSDMEYYLFR
jgi:hypothetical protein